MINSTALYVSWSDSSRIDVVSYFATVSSAARSTSVTVLITSGIGDSQTYLDHFVVFDGLFPYTDYSIRVGGTLMNTNMISEVARSMRTAEAGKVDIDLSEIII